MKVFLFTAVGAYLAYAAAMVALHPRLIYPFSRDDSVLDGFQRLVIATDGEVPISVQER